MLVLHAALFAQDPGAGAVVALAPVKEAELRSARAKAARDGMQLAGIQRKLKKASQRGEWLEAPGKGWIWAVKIVSPGAAALRVHAVRTAGTGGALSVQEPGGKSAAQAWPDEWSSITYGDAVIVRYAPPGGTRPSGGKLPFRIDAISHQLR